MKIVAFIFARGGSKGIPGKNIRPLAGKPLLAYSIEMAKKVADISRIFVSTDDDKIAQVAVEYGAEVIVRPKELSQDDSPEWLAWRHATEWVENSGFYFDCFLSLPATSPLRNKDDITACLSKFDSQVDMIVTMTETNRSPYFNMITEKKDGYMEPLAADGRKYTRRQDVPEAYDMTTVAYVTSPDFIKRNSGVFDGRVKAVLIPKERAVDIDDEVDFILAETLMTRTKDMTNAE